MTTAAVDFPAGDSASIEPQRSVHAPSSFQRFLTEASGRLAAVAVLLLVAGVLLGFRSDLAAYGSRLLVGALALSQLALAAGLGSRIVARRRGMKAPVGPIVFAAVLMGVVTISLVVDRFGYLQRTGDEFFDSIEKKDAERPTRRPRPPRN